MSDARLGLSVNTQGEKKAHGWGGGGGSALVFSNVVGKIFSKESSCFYTGSLI